MKRINRRSLKTEFDKIIELQKKVRENYLKLAKRFPEIKTVNGLADVEAIHRDVVALVERELGIK